MWVYIHTQKQSYKSYKNNPGSIQCKNFVAGSCPYDSECCYYEHDVLVQGDVTFSMEGSSGTAPPGQPQNIENKNLEPFQPGRGESQPYI